MGIRIAWHALRSDHERCVCGSEAVFAKPGAFAPILPLFSRYGCRACRRTFWLRRNLTHDHAHTSAAQPAVARQTTISPELHLGVEIAKHDGSRIADPIKALDAAVGSSPAPPRPESDLAALDGQLDQLNEPRG
jgi:hypothetical protein